MEYNLPLTKEFKALKIWMTLKAYGARKIRNEIFSDIRKAQYLVNLIQKNSKLELLAPAPLSIVCFRYNPDNMGDKMLNKVNNRLINKIETDGFFLLELKYGVKQH